MKDILSLISAIDSESKSAAFEEFCHTFFANGFGSLNSETVKTTILKIIVEMIDPEMSKSEDELCEILKITPSNFRNLHEKIAYKSSVSLSRIRTILKNNFENSINTNAIRIVVKSKSRTMVQIAIKNTAFRLHFRKHLTSCGIPFESRNNFLLIEIHDFCKVTKRLSDCSIEEILASAILSNEEIKTSLQNSISDLENIGINDTSLSHLKNNKKALDSVRKILPDYLKNIGAEILVLLLSKWLT